MKKIIFEEENTLGDKIKITLNVESGGKRTETFTIISNRIEKMLNEFTDFKRGYRRRTKK